MTVFLKLLLCSCLIVITYGKSVEEVRERFMSLGIECNKEIAVPPEQLLMLHKHQIPDSNESHCLLACVYRKATWLNDKGLLDVEGAKAMLEKEHVDDAEKIKNSNKLIDTCKSVNDETVNDGDKGCDRSALLAKCLIENASKVLTSKYYVLIFK